MSVAGSTMASTNLLSSTPTNEYNYDSKVLLTGGTITVIDDWLTIEANSTNDLIISVKVMDSWGKVVALFTGCGSNYCQYDISSLSTGTYFVKVKAKYSNFDGTISR